jgi:hypothetical protein
MRGSHLPVLMKVVNMTTGPILELGCGTYSTQYLHWACLPTKRPLTTYENNPTFYEYLQQFERDLHAVHCVPSIVDADLSAPWTVALVDCDRHPRGPVVAKLLHAEYVIVHDTESRCERTHHYGDVFRQFKYQWRWRDVIPNTTILSNIHDVSGFQIP